jgi:hypothetical protein
MEYLTVLFFYCDMDKINRQLQNIVNLTKQSMYH